MPTKIDPDTVRAEAVQILKIFKATPDLKVTVGPREKPETFSHAEMAALDEAVKAAADTVKDKRAELKISINARDTLAQKLNEVLVQGRGGIAAKFGRDSDEYELAGGTRTSERRTRTRKPKGGPDKPGA